MATDDITIPQHVGISEAPRDVEAIKAQEKASILSHWNADIAFKLGYNLRTRLLTQERPAVVHISTISTPPHVLFHAVRLPFPATAKIIIINSVSSPQFRKI